MRRLQISVILGCFYLLLVACETATGNQGQSRPTVSNAVQLSPISSSESATANTASSPDPTVAPGQTLSERLEANAVVLYTKQEGIQPLPLLAWPELSVLDQPEFSSIYGQELGHQYAEDFAPQLNASGRYLMIPGIQWQGTDQPGNQTTWLADLDTGQIRELEHHPIHAVWSPDGNRLAYVKEDILYLEKVNEDGEPTAHFTKAGLSPLFIDWSPDGQQLAVSSQMIGASIDGDYPPITDTVWLVSAESDSAQQLGTFPSYPVEHRRHELQWSPDGSALLIGMVNPNYILRLDGSRTALEEGSKGLAWMPDGSALLVRQEEGLLIIDKQGEPVIQVTDVGRLVRAWAFSPDGRFLAYTYEDLESETSQLAIFDLEKREAKLIPAPSPTIPSLHWTPTSNVLVLDDGDLNTPIWAVVPASDGAAKALIEEGLLINIIPKP